MPCWRCPPPLTPLPPRKLPPRPTPNLSLTASLLYLSGAVEYALDARNALGLEIAGRKRENDTWLRTDVQYRYYFIAPARHGIYGSANAAWVLYRDREYYFSGVSGQPGHGWENDYIMALGPALGYKYVHPWGLTADIHLGGGGGWIKSRGQDWKMSPYPAVFAGANVGWSFRI